MGARECRLPAFDVRYHRPARGLTVIQLTRRLPLGGRVLAERVLLVASASLPGGAANGH